MAAVYVFLMSLMVLCFAMYVYENEKNMMKFQLECMKNIKELYKRDNLIKEDVVTVKQGVEDVTMKLNKAVETITTIDESSKKDFVIVKQGMDDVRMKLDKAVETITTIDESSKKDFVTVKQGMKDVSIRLNKANEKITALTEDTKKGASYKRWGRKDCPSLSGTELVYAGLAGGGSHSETGSGVNYLCLPRDPDQPHLVSAMIPQFAGAFARVYGAEYQFSYSNVKLDDDVPCAVCLDTHATTKIMIPGKTTCPQRWRKQYEGLLCADKYDHAGPSEFECLDINPQYIDGRRNNFNGRLFYPAITKCGSLQCPPYEDG